MIGSPPLDVLVTCFAHDDEVVHFPQVRGYYLAKHLAKAGLRAEFRQLPQPGVRCEVVICSEYQCEPEQFQRRIAQPLSELSAQRMYCMADRPVLASGHFSREHCQWFADRGGVLVHLDARRTPAEHWIGVGVDTDVVRLHPGPRDAVLFDFPRSRVDDPAASFDVAKLELVRARLPGCRLVGTGQDDAPVRSAFDEWVSYGQPHAAYVARAFRGVFAVVPGVDESMGLAIAEAQVAGACVVSRSSDLEPSMLCPEAAVTYEPDDTSSLAAALGEARSRSPARIVRQASARFDFRRVVERTRRAIGL